MPRKNAKNDDVSAVRSQLPSHLASLPRDKIKHALLYYESIDETVEAFIRDGAIEVFSDWTEKSSSRGPRSNKQTNNKSGNKSSSQTPPSNAILRPSQRVSNIFQTFAEGGVPITTTTTTTTTTAATTSSPSSSYYEPMNPTLQSYPSTDLSFHPCLSQDSTINTSESLLNVIESNGNEFHDTSNATTNSSTTTDEINLLTTTINSTNGHDEILPQRRRSIRDRNGSTSSNHQQSQPSESNDIQKPTTVTKSSSNPSSGNRKILTKSTKDLQRQTSTLSNIESSFENEIKSSVKRIDDVFKQLREILKERELELYLEMDKVKEHGLNIIHRRQERASELRQRVDHCDRLEPVEIDSLRTDIKQFVTDRRYDLGEELTSSHRFEYDQNLIEALKTFGTVLRIDRKYERARTLSTSSALAEPKENTTMTTENLPTTSINGRITSNELDSTNHPTSLPQRINPKQNFNGNNAGDYYHNSHPPQQQQQTNGFYQYYDDSYNYQTVNHRRRPPQTSSSQQHNGNSRRTRPHPPPPPSSVPSSSNNPPRRNGFHNSETNKTYRRPRPVPPTIVSPISN